MPGERSSVFGFLVNVSTRDASHVVCSRFGFNSDSDHAMAVEVWITPSTLEIAHNTLLDGEPQIVIMLYVRCPYATICECHYHMRPPFGLCLDAV